jgi:DNA-binding PadR family transcriptional regulator
MATPKTPAPDAAANAAALASAATRRSPLALAVLALLAYKPLHPYGVQRLLKEWGKEKVVNVGQRAGLYKTMERLLAAGLIAVRETGRDQLYPERTVYEVTDTGRGVVLAWIEEIVRTPKAEFPEFPAALSFAMMLGPELALSAFEERKAVLEKQLDQTRKGIEEAKGYGLPSITLLDDTYLAAVAEAEIAWLDGVVEQLRSGEMTWDRELLSRFAGDAAES